MTEYTYAHLPKETAIFSSNFTLYDTDTNCFDEDADLVKCNNCSHYGFVELAADTCPNCNYEGALQDISLQDISDTKVYLDSELIFDPCINDDERI